jgi:hypothetical protein
MNSNNFQSPVKPAMSPGNSNAISASEKATLLLVIIRFANSRNRGVNAVSNRHMHDLTFISRQDIYWLEKHHIKNSIQVKPFTVQFAK